MDKGKKRVPTSNIATMDEMDLRCPYHPDPRLRLRLQSTKISSECHACYKKYYGKKQGYKCYCISNVQGYMRECDFYVHEECMNTNIPSRHKHPLKLRSCDDSFSCCLCEIPLSLLMFYDCSLCSFRICIPCTRKPLMIRQHKAHEHKLYQTPIKLSFTCDACGLCSTGFPFICHQCCFIIHRECITLPRVININHHEHRISHVFSLGPEKWFCGVCYEPVNGACGAYSCLVCSYVVHSKCATNQNVWDGKELEGIPEEDVKEESKPFERIDENLIKHFSHEHNLKKSISSGRLDEDVVLREEGKHCYACTLLLYSESCYKCTQCDFILHDACANFPRNKINSLFNEKLTLCVKGEDNFTNLSFCIACRRYCNGFSYVDSQQLNSIDLRCASISVPLKHESHPHWLVLHRDTLRVPVKSYILDARCEGCDLSFSHFLHCNGKDDCGGFTLCFTCATLPTLLRHKYDDHPLSLYYGDKNGMSIYWCGICEEEINSKNWFYKCNDCGSTLHTKCVFQNLIHSRPGYSSKVDDEWILDLLPNNGLSRPICFVCKTRCVDDFLLKSKEDKNKFLCCHCGYSIYWNRVVQRFSDALLG